MVAQALARSIAARLLRCSKDELRVIDVVLVRLELGRESYGPLDLSKPRDWQREAAEELVDERFYRACKLISDRDDRIAEIEARLDEVIANAPDDITADFPFDTTDLDR